MNDEEKQRLEDLERRIGELEEQVKKQWWSYPWEELIKQPALPKAGEEAQCPQCGMIFKGAMGFYCSSMNCPMGVGPTII